MELQPGLEPASKRFLEFLNNTHGKEIEEMTVEEARQALLIQRIGEQTLPPADLMDVTVPFRDVAALPIRIIRPKESQGPLPVVVYFHGGGWVLGCKEGFDRAVREIAVGSGAALVFVEYPLAPEAKFPVAVEACFAVTKHIAE